MNFRFRLRHKDNIDELNVEYFEIFVGHRKVHIAFSHNQNIHEIYHTLFDLSSIVYLEHRNGCIK